MIPILRYLLPTVSTEALVSYMKNPETNRDLSYNDLMYEELLNRGFFLQESSLDLIKE